LPPDAKPITEKLMTAKMALTNPMDNGFFLDFMFLPLTVDGVSN
jgi:hypothetical protein